MARKEVDVLVLGSKFDCKINFATGVETGCLIVDPYSNLRWFVPIRFNQEKLQLQLVANAAARR